MALQIGQIRHVGLFTSHLKEHARFYSEVWGLDPVSETKDTVFLRGSAPEYFILSFHRGAGAGLHHIAYSMASNDAVGRAVSELKLAGVRIVQDAHDLDEPG